MIVSAAALVSVGRHGPGISGDSFTYTSMSKHFAAGQGASYYNNTTGGRSLPMTWFAPLWPAVLSPIHFLKLPYREASLALLALFLFANLLLAGLIARGVTGRAGPAICLQLLLAADANWLTWHFYLLTEGLFFLQLHAAIYCVWRYSQGERPVWLWAAAAVASSFALNRYIGVSLVPAFLLLIWLTPRVSKSASRRAAVAAAVMLLPFGLWLLRNHHVSGIGYDKSLPGVDTSRYFVSEMARSVLSNVGEYVRKAAGMGNWATVIECALAAACVWTGVRAWRGQARFSLKVAAVAAIYLIGLWAAMTWRHMSAMSDEVRYLTPFYQLVWIAIVIGMCEADGPVRWPAVRRVAGVFFAFGCAVQFMLWCAKVWAAGVDGNAGKGWIFMNTIRWFPQ